jgi:hypothetical protein
MKKLGKVAVTLLLLASLVLSLASCDLIFPNRHRKGYTGGVLAPSNEQSKRFWQTHEVHWVETYEEAMLAIEHLQANGNNVSARISTYENEYIDAKYFFYINKQGSKGLEKGQTWYDREDIQSTVYVRYLGFLDKVTIEELEYSYYHRYRTFEFEDASDQYNFDPALKTDFLYSQSESETVSGTFRLVQDGKVMCTFECYNINPQDLIESGLVEGFKTEFPKTIVILNTAE